MKFEEYLEKHCGNVGDDFWKNWIGQNGTKLQIALKINYTGQRYDWANEYCNGTVLFSGSWVLFEFEDDSVLFAMRWI